MDVGFILFVVIVVLAIAGIGFAPLFFIKNKADGFGAEISWMQAFQLLSRQSTDKEFLKSIALDQGNNLEIGITPLETHLLAGGDPLVVVEALILAREIGMELDFGQLSTIELAGKNPLEAVEKTKEVVTMEISNFKIKDFEIEYHAQYRFGIGRIFGEHASGEIEDNVKKRLDSFGRDWDHQDASKTQNFLLRHILNPEYWEKVVGVQLVQHYLEVRLL